MVYTKHVLVGSAPLYAHIGMGYTQIKTNYIPIASLAVRLALMMASGVGWALSWCRWALIMLWELSMVV